MVDQRGRDAPRNFHLSTQVGAYKYHALLYEKVELERKLVFDVTSEGSPAKRSADGTMFLWLDAGIYGFPRVEDRDKFCRKCNFAADAEPGLPVCFPVTIPNVHLFLAEEESAASPKTITGPVAEDDVELDEDFDPDNPAL